MEKEYIRYIKSLIDKIGGPQLPSENKKAWFSRVSLCCGVGFSSLKAAYYGQNIGPNIYVSATTVKRLEDAAAVAEQMEELKNDNSFRARAENWIQMLEESDPQFFREDIEALRRIRVLSERISALQSQSMGDAAEARRRMVDQLRSFDEEEGEGDH